MSSVQLHTRQLGWVFVHCSSGSCRVPASGTLACAGHAARQPIGRGTYSSSDRAHCVSQSKGRHLGMTVCAVPQQVAYDRQEDKGLSPNTSSVFDLPQLVQNLSGEDADAFKRIYRVTRGVASCRVSNELASKYKMEQDNKQLVVSITNTWAHEQAWFNEVRSRKPQTFTSTSNKPADPTGGGGPGRCDFCDWDKLTAEDPWGRIEAQHAVTASNLFKYGEPAHGLALFKHHDPLQFSQQQLRDLLAVSQAWFTAANAHHASNGTATQSGHHQAEDSSSNSILASCQHSREGGLHAFFIWNALARAGASQYHGHAQLMASSVPVPSQAQLDMQAESYASKHPGRQYLKDVLAAHRAVGLLRACAATSADADTWRQIAAGGTDKQQLPRPPRAWIAACLTPIKDMEILVAVELPAAVNDGQQQQQQQQCGSCDGASVGIASAVFCTALHASLRALIDQLQVESFNAGILNIPCGPRQQSMSQGSSASIMLARIVSRGRLSQQASDFGCLEVIGGASIGHTDPYRVISAVESQLADCLIPHELPI